MENGPPPGARTWPANRQGRRTVTWVVLSVVVVSAGIVAIRAGLRGNAMPGGPGPAPTARARPNVVLIVTDDQRWNSLFAMPNVERYLVRRGVTFTNAFVTTSLCCPSRASILTGEYSRHTGVYNDSGGPHGGAPAFKDTSTLATWLHGVGYDTALVGKYMNSYNLIAHHIPPGWSHWDAIDSAKPALHYYDYAINEDGQLHYYGSDPSDYVDTVLGHLGTQFLATARPPFFLEFCPTAPHAPAIPAPGDEQRFHVPLPYRPNFNEADMSDKPWAGMFPRFARTGFITRFWDQQLDSLQQVDRTVGAFVRVLRIDGQLANTVFVFTTDNGILLGEHRLAIVKVWPYEESIRVPLVIAGAGVVDPGRTNPDFALNIDLAPTIAQLAGVRPGLPVDGRSLVPLMMNRHPPWRTSFVVEYLGNGGAGDDYVAPFEGIRTLRYLYVRYGRLRVRVGGPLVPYPNGSEELYDLKSDPYELRNLARLPQYQQLRARLAGQLARLLRR